MRPSAALTLSLYRTVGVKSNHVNASTSVVAVKIDDLAHTHSAYLSFLAHHLDGRREWMARYIKDGGMTKVSKHIRVRYKGLQERRRWAQFKCRLAFAVMPPTLTACRKLWRSRRGEVTAEMLAAMRRQYEEAA